MSEKTETTDVDASTSDALASTIRRLESTVDDLQRQLDELRAERTPSATPVAGAAPTTPAAIVDHPDEPDRRQLLRRAGAATAGALAGGVVLAAGTATPAAAANGGNMILGANNSATNITQLTGTMSVETSNSTNTFSAESSIPSGGDAIRGFAYGTNGVGVRASSTNGPGLVIQNGTQVIPPQAGSWQVGAFLIAGSHLHYCYSGGTGPASKWARLSTTFVAFDGPIRVYDSRPGTVPATPPKTRFVDHEERTLSLTVNNAIPAGISPTAVAVNLTATNTNPGGYFTAWRSTIPWPGTSSVNWSMANQTIANQSVIRTNGLAQIKVRCEGAGGADLVVDVVGYYL